MLSSTELPCLSLERQLPEMQVGELRDLFGTNFIQ